MFPAPVEAVICDMDGLLLDTEQVYRRAFITAAETLGFAMSEAFYSQMVGLADEECYALIGRHFGGEFPLARYRKEAAARLERLLEAGIPSKPGARELVETLARRGLPRAVATSTHRALAELHLRQAGLLQAFDAVVTFEDVARGKPHPDIFLKAASVLRVPPPRCLVLEDSHLGIRAAHAAGSMPVMVPDLLPATEELRRMCVAVVADLHAVRRLLAAS
jgi:HAD superfamily hydrolase (TIGR01509 family)